MSKSGRRAPSGRRQNARLKFLGKHRGGNTSRRPKDGPKKERKFLSRIPLQKTGSGAALFSREFRPNPREILESVSGVSGVSGGGSSAYPLSPIWRHSGPENSNQYLLPARRTAQCRLETPAEIRVVTGSRGPKKAHQKGREFLPKIPGRQRCQWCQWCQSQQPFVVQKDLAGFGFAVVAPSEVFRKISQNFSPAGVTSPFMARAIPTDNTSVVPVSGR